MIKRVLLAAAALGAVSAVPASAVTIVATPNAFAAPGNGGPGGYSFDFNGTTASEIAKFQAAGFTDSSTGSASVQTSSVPNQYLTPAPGDGSGYGVVQANSSVDFYRAGSSFQSISIYIGSLDTYNSISLLNSAGQVIAGQTYTGTQLISPLTPNSVTSYRITFNRQVGDVAIGGLRIISTTNNSAEFDNLVFAVPEPSTWALMLAGFGMVGMAMRARRRRTNVVFA